MAQTSQRYLRLLTMEIYCKTTLVLTQLPLLIYQDFKRKFSVMLLTGQMESLQKPIPLTTMSLQT